MMHECKRILNGEVASGGLWEVQLGTASETAGADCVQVQGLEDEELQEDAVTVI